MRQPINLALTKHLGKILTVAMLAIGIAVLLQVTPIRVDAARPTPIANGIDLDQAIKDANESKKADTIVLAAANSPYLIPNTLTISSKISIAGNGATIQGNNTFSICSVTSDGNLILNDLTVTGGAAAKGGGIYNAGGTVALNGCTISGNEAGGGGGIYNTSGGEVTLTNSSISDNTAGGDGGGIFNNGATGTVTLTNSSVDHNTAGAAAGIYNLSGTVTLEGSSVDHNTADIRGGGIYNLSGTVTVEGSSIKDNTAGLDGGGIFNATDLLNNGATATVNLTNSSVDDNTAGSDGGGASSNGQSFQ